MPQEPSYRFGRFTLDPGAQVLLREGQPVDIQPRPFDVLVLLVKAHGRLVLKDEMLSQVWTGTFVEEGSLARTVSMLRTVLGDRGSYIQTVPKRGYRFVAPVEEFQSHQVPVSIAVLPFAEAGDAADDLLGFGVADSLIGRLSQMSGLAVRPMSAVLRYQHQRETPLEVADELGVEYVLDGRLQRHDHRIKVGVQLIERQTRSVVWGQQLDEGPAGIFRIQSAIAERTAEALAKRLSRQDRERLTRAGTDSEDAYLACVRGRYYLNRLDLGRNAVAQFERAIDLDPGYALAYAGLADAIYVTCAPAGATQQPRATIPKAKAAAARALDLDPGLGEAWQTFAMLRFWEDWDRQHADSEYQRAIELKPNCPHARLIYVWFLTAVGRFAEAEAEARRAIELDPLSPMASTSLALPAYFARDYATAIARLEPLALESGFWYRDYLLGAAYADAGRFDDARAILERAGRDTSWRVLEVRTGLARALALAGETDAARHTADDAVPGRTPGLSAYYLAGAWAAIGDRDAAFAWLDTAVREHDKWTAWIPVDPAMDSLRADPRFADVLGSCGFQA